MDITNCPRCGYIFNKDVSKVCPNCGIKANKTCSEQGFTQVIPKHNIDTIYD